MRVYRQKAIEIESYLRIAQRERMLNRVHKVIDQINVSICLYIYKCLDTNINKGFFLESKEPCSQ